MSEADHAEQGRQPDEPAASPDADGAGGDGAGGDGFPGEDVGPDESDPDLDVNDPFSVGDEREPLEPGSGDGSAGDDAPEDDASED